MQLNSSKVNNKTNSTKVASIENTNNGMAVKKSVRRPRRQTIQAANVLIGDDGGATASNNTVFKPNSLSDTVDKTQQVALQVISPLLAQSSTPKKVLKIAK